jgi:hypothetical protein
VLVQQRQERHARLRAQAHRVRDADPLRGVVEVGLLDHVNPARQRGLFVEWVGLVPVQRALHTTASSA